jgi:hypothetical protein
MRRLGFALPAVVLITLLAAAPVALAQGGGGGNPPPTGWTFSMTIDKTATFTNPLTNPGILLHVTGMYTCQNPVDGSGNDSYGFPFDPNNSGLNVNVNEIVKNDIISGGGGSDGSLFICDTYPHAWSADLFGNNSNNLSALWKTGKAIAQANGQICDTGGNCAGTNVQRVIMIKH